jgi:hypothetical protein
MHEPKRAPSLIAQPMQRLQPRDHIKQHAQGRFEREHGPGPCGFRPANAVDELTDDETLGWTIERLANARDMAILQSNEARRPVLPGGDVSLAHFAAAGDSFNDNEAPACAGDRLEGPPG